MFNLEPYIGLFMMRFVSLVVFSQFISMPDQLTLSQIFIIIIIVIIIIIIIIILGNLTISSSYLIFYFVLRTEDMWFVGWND